MNAWAPCILIALPLAVGACEKREAPSQGRADAAPPAIISPAVLRSICQREPCGGDRASVNVWRNRDNQVSKLYRMYGSCFHSPGLYLEPDGTLADTIPEHPITPGSPEAAELQRRHDKQVGGLTFTDVIRCSDGARLPPK